MRSEWLQEHEWSGRPERVQQRAATWFADGGQRLAAEVERAMVPGALLERLTGETERRIAVFEPRVPVRVDHEVANAVRGQVLLLVGHYVQGEAHGSQLGSVLTVGAHAPTTAVYEQSAVAVGPGNRCVAAD